MLKIAIVGNIASGKSTVEKILEERGFKVYDTDKIAHEILEKNSKVKEVFNTTDRKEIAKIVFKNKEKLKLLESIIHPEVKNELEKIFAINEKIVFVSVPQLFEAGLNILFDKIIFVNADENIRKARLIQRNSLTDNEAQVRIDAQIIGEKIKKSDFVINNNGTIDELNQQVEAILKEILIL